MILLLCCGLFLRVAAVFVHDGDEWVRRRCSAGRVLCAQLPPDSQVTALAIAELSTTGAFAARTIRLLRRGLFSCGPTVPMRDGDAWAQRRCPAGCMLCAQLLLDSPL